jgi:hypothetical protein
MASLTSGSLAALNDAVAASPLDNFGTAGVIISGTWVGTISFEGSLDNVNFVPIFIQEISGTQLTTETTTNGQFLVNTSGMFSIRVKMTAFTSGTADITMQANATPFLQRSLSTLAGDTDGTLVGNDGDGVKNVIKGAGSSDLVEVETKTNSTKSLSTTSEISGSDALAAYRKVNTKVRSDGLTALATDATVVVESTFGFDQNPDSFFRIIDTGPAGATWTIDIAGTTNDASTPDRDVPAYQKIFTVSGGEAGDEIAFRDRIITELNQDSTFRNTVFLKAQKATDRAVVHIYSENFSASGEFWERPNAGDFAVTLGGTAGAVVVVGFDNVISRSKPVTITRDFDSPHRLGLFGITGDVNVTSKALSDLFIEKASLNGDLVTHEMAVNGSGTDQVFRINAKVDSALFIQEIRFYGQGNGIQFGKFLNQNNALTEGIFVEIKSENVITDLFPIKTTEDFKNEFSFGNGAGSFEVIFASGRDEFIATFEFSNPFLLEESGAHGAGNDDFIEIRIRDNLSNVGGLGFLAKGFEKEP